MPYAGPAETLAADEARFVVQETVPSEARPHRSRLIPPTSLPVESVSRVEFVDGGWQVNFEVVELERVPRLTDVLASYEVDVDKAGNPGPGAGCAATSASSRRSCDPLVRALPGTTVGR
jgi:hypothetical protein